MKGGLSHLKKGGERLEEGSFQRNARRALRFYSKFKRSLESLSIISVGSRLLCIFTSGERIKRLPRPGAQKEELRARKGDREKKDI